MKYSTLCLLLFILLLPAACDIESTDNGNLDGFWHLEQVDTLATGGSLNLKEQKIFWGVQYHLIHLTGAGQANNFYLRFRQTGDSLYITQAFIEHSGTAGQQGNGDEPLTNDSLLQIYGLQSSNEQFIKVKLNGKWLILKSARLQLTFRRF